jgi:hypothetical protein
MMPSFVFAQSAGDRIIAVLAEEVSFTDGFIG